MKIANTFVALAILFLAACSNDSGSNSNLLSFDGDNVSAPELAVGAHELAVQFTADELSGRIGKKLTQIEAFLAPGAVSYKMVVHGPGTDVSPGPIIWEKNITSNVDSQGWIIVNLDSPIEITGEDLWLGVKVVHIQAGQTIGCDSGPRHDGGDWIWDDTSQTWETFLHQTTTELVNWNIRGHLED